MNAVQCPVCASTDIQEVGLHHKGNAISSDWLILSDAEIRPGCCRGCGLIFEARGVRAFSHEFYDQIFRPKPMMRVYGRADALSRHDKAVELISEMIPMAGNGRMVEIGSGKGQFLKRFRTTYPEWAVTGLEPSISFESLRQAVADAETFRTGYEGYACEPASKDLVVALGVIEHVDNPLDMLRWAARALKVGGYLFLEAPNFENHPNDLFCPDHLSKLTPRTLENLAAAAGFSVAGSRFIGVPMFFALQKSGEAPAALTCDYAENLAVAEKNERAAHRILDAVGQARAAASGKSERFGIFGLASGGLIAPFMLGFPPDEIAAFMDDNSDTWGTQIYGRPVGGPALIEEQAIRHVALSLSPVYAPAVARRLRELGAAVYGSGNEQ